MKLFSYLLVACAGLGLFACNTEDEVPAVDTGKTQSVVLKIEGVTPMPTTKAIDAATTTTTMTLKDVKIVFYDQSDNKIYRIVELESGDTDWAAITGSGVVYHNLSQLVDGVLIVGNYKGKAITWTDAGTIRSSKLDAAGENTEPAPSNDSKDYVTLYGEDLQLVTSTTSPDPDPEHVVLLDAVLTLKPLVARFEIGNVQCSNLNEALYASFELQGIGLIDFNRKVDLSSGLAQLPRLGIAVPTPSTDPYILPPGSTAGTGQYTFGDELSAIAWSYEPIGNIVMDDSTDIHNPAGGKYAFNFFPGNPAGTTRGFPNIKLILNNVTPLDPLVTVPFNNVTTISFAETTLTATAGHIYQINLIFKEVNIGPWDPTAVICVNVVVTVQPWTIHQLTPTYY
ncbi:hypothetical protein [Macellibacteroides fermentans]|uniref:hypothetical protein n=1 Tax=Macellibacteroides fermentans TaxID=879969 RepID=UPI002BC833DD|nr:hypothetical protein [Macellibacteroides fermentans]